MLNWKHLLLGLILPTTLALLSSSASGIPPVAAELTGAGSLTDISGYPAIKRAAADPFALKGTGINDETSERDISEPVSVNHPQPDGEIERRWFRYSTPRNFARRANRSVNLWIVFHGQNGNSSTMHRFFEEIPHTSPTLIVYPKALKTDLDNLPDESGNAKTRWRNVRKPGDASEPNTFRDVVFVEWLVENLLDSNPQLNPNKVYASGFSSGSGLTWMLLCYRSSLFKGFGMYSQQLGSFRENGACGNGQLSQSEGTLTGYERLTGQPPDRYGFRLSGFPSSLGLPSSSPQLAPSKAVFYAHGTLDSNLAYGDDPGCWERGECELPDDPQYSMDPGGPLEARDDVSSINWLRSRHRLLSIPPEDAFILDADRANGDDEVVTLSRTYKSDPESTTDIAVDYGEPIRWYEMRGAGHSMSAIDSNEGVTDSKDYDVSVMTQRFFENEAGMLAN